MVPSDSAPVPHGVRRRRRVSVAVGVLVGFAALVLVLGAVVTSGFRGAQDERRDEIVKAFREHQSAFEAAVDQMTGLAAEHPDALRIGWSQALICVTDGTGAERCTDTNEEQRAAFGQLAGANTVVRQPKDGGRVFFRFDVEDPPVTYLLHDPDGRDAKAYADAQGFAWSHEITDHWSVLGQIRDVEKQSSMWVG